MDNAGTFEYEIRKDFRNNPIVREVDERRLRDLWTSLGIGVALVTVLLLTLLCLLAAGPMMKLMGAKFEGALTRLLGVVLAALAAQFVIDGIKQSFGL